MLKLVTSFASSLFSCFLFLCPSSAPSFSHLSFLSVFLSHCRFSSCSATPHMFASSPSNLSLTPTAHQLPRTSLTPLHARAHSMHHSLARNPYPGPNIRVRLIPEPGDMQANGGDKAALRLPFNNSVSSRLLVPFSSLVPSSSTYPYPVYTTPFSSPMPTSPLSSPPPTTPLLFASQRCCPSNNRLPLSHPHPRTPSLSLSVTPPLPLVQAVNTINALTPSTSRRRNIIVPSPRYLTPHSVTNPSSSPPPTPCFETE